MNSQPKANLKEIMVIEASKFISNGDTVMVGTGMPFVASIFALKSHAPEMCFVVETGTIAPEVIPIPISVSDPRVMHRAVKLGSLLDALGGILHRGMADIGFLGGAQIDKFANVNSTLIGDKTNPKVRLPGSGGANDIASHAKQILIIAPHEKRRFPEKCDYITSPGYIDGPEGRVKASLPVEFPDISVVTDLAIMKINKSKGILEITHTMPSISVNHVIANTGFTPLISDNIQIIPVPTKDELDLLRNTIDPNGVYV
ncbi:MAG: glutaconate CoA-transferase [SAR202 cluster bacterium]|nr:glutaconate CoA-transferase [SAR202 cluster bacterium]|tara:strand:+ start:3428 stop:4201 length:774 start_codon:yes stop_codon:yes gene_type:complete